MIDKQTPGGLGSQAPGVTTITDEPTTSLQQLEAARLLAECRQLRRSIRSRRLNHFYDDERCEEAAYLARELLAQRTAAWLILSYLQLVNRRKFVPSLPDEQLLQIIENAARAELERRELP
jgi:hypothetical protein